MSKTGTVRSRGDLPSWLRAEIVTVVRAAREKKASDIVVLDLRKATAFTDCFIVCSGQNVRHVKAIVDAIADALLARRVKPSLVEGYERAEWVLMDFFDFIVHVFTPDTRAFYALERLWADATHIEIPDESGREASAGQRR